MKGILMTNEKWQLLRKYDLYDGRPMYPNAILVPTDKLISLVEELEYLKRQFRKLGPEYEGYYECG